MALRAIYPAAAQGLAGERELLRLVARRPQPPLDQREPHLCREDGPSCGWPLPIRANNGQPDAHGQRARQRRRQRKHRRQPTRRDVGPHHELFVRGSAAWRTAGPCGQVAPRPLAWRGVGGVGGWGWVVALPLLRLRQAGGTVTHSTRKCRPPRGPGSTGESSYYWRRCTHR